MDGQEEPGSWRVAGVCPGGAVQTSDEREERKVRRVLYSARGEKTPGEGRREEGAVRLAPQPPLGLSGLFIVHGETCCEQARDLQPELHFSVQTCRE